MDIIEDIMTKEIFTCEPKTDILKVKSLMLKHRIKRVVVVDVKNKPKGIITQKDIVKYLLTDKSRRELDRIYAEEVMSKDLITVNPIAPVIDVAKTMIKKKISSLVVVDENYMLKGIVTKAD
jgi:CBS domain-containing protein